MKVKLLSYPEYEELGVKYHPLEREKPQLTPRQDADQELPTHFSDLLYSAAKTTQGALYICLVQELSDPSVKGCWVDSGLFTKQDRCFGFFIPPYLNKKLKPFCIENIVFGSIGNAQPIHPGQILEEHYIKPLHLNLEKLAKRLFISRKYNT